MFCSPNNKLFIIVTHVHDLNRMEAHLRIYDQNFELLQENEIRVNYFVHDIRFYDDDDGCICFDVISGCKERCGKVSYKYNECDGKFDKQGIGKPIRACTERWRSAKLCCDCKDLEDVFHQGLSLHPKFSLKCPWVMRDINFPGRHEYWYFERGQFRYRSGNNRVFDLFRMEGDDFYPYVPVNALCFAWYPDSKYNILAVGGYSSPIYFQIINNDEIERIGSIEADVFSFCGQFKWKVDFLKWNSPTNLFVGISFSLSKKSCKKQNEVYEVKLYEVERKEQPEKDKKERLDFLRERQGEFGSPGWVIAANESGHDFDSIGDLCARFSELTIAKSDNNGE